MRDPVERGEVVLSVRSRRILELLASGMTNKEVAHACGFSESAAKWHVSRLLTFYRVPNRAALVRRAIADHTVALDADDFSVGDQFVATKSNVQ